MDFKLTDEQTLLRDMVAKLVADTYDFEARRAMLAAPPVAKTDAWRSFAELGLVTVTVPEAQGGLGGGAIEAMIVQEELGRGLVLEPWLASAVVATSLAVSAGSRGQALLQSLASGETIAAAALYERRGRFDVTHVETRASASGDGFVLDGEKSAVIGGGIADCFLVSAMHNGSICLFRVAADAPGAHIAGARAVDATSMASIVFDGVRVDADALLLRDALPAIERAIDAGVAGLCAEAVGVMAKAVELTSDYLRTRQQFGKPIASFQALQHACVDMFIATEEARSAAILAATRGASDDAATRIKAISAAKVTINKSARLVGQKAIQLHGGVGMTDEYAISHYFKRLTAMEQLFGDTDHHVARFIAA